MKIRSFFRLFGLLIIIACFSACTKSSTSNPLSSLKGVWMNSTWGRSGDTIKVNITPASASGTIIYLSTGYSHFSPGDVIFSNITSAGNNSFTCTGTYRYGTNNANVGTTTATMTLQSSSQLYVHYAADATTGITPPDYYYQKQ